eukprot:Opistho-2@24872
MVRHSRVLIGTEVLEQSVVQRRSEAGYGIPPGCGGEAVVTARVICSAVGIAHSDVVKELTRMREGSRIQPWGDKPKRFETVVEAVVVDKRNETGKCGGGCGSASLGNGLASKHHWDVIGQCGDIRVRAHGRIVRRCRRKALGVLQVGADCLCLVLGLREAPVKRAAARIPSMRLVGRRVGPFGAADTKHIRRSGGECREVVLAGNLVQRLCERRGLLKRLERVVRAAVASRRKQRHAARAQFGKLVVNAVHKRRLGVHAHLALALEIGDARVVCGGGIRECGDGLHAQYVARVPAKAAKAHREHRGYVVLVRKSGSKRKKSSAESLAPFGGRRVISVADDSADALANRRNVRHVKGALAKIVATNSAGLSLMLEQRERVVDLELRVKRREVRVRKAECASAPHHLPVLAVRSLKGVRHVVALALRSRRPRTRREGRGPAR